MLDDEVAVDNDIVAQNPLSNTALAAQDVTSADPASAIGQRISTNQTGAAAEARGAAIPQATVASKLATQQSPVHTEESGYGLVGGADAGAAEAFRKGRQYQAMKQQYSALRDIASPTQEGVSSSSVLPSVTPPGPVKTSVGERLRGAGLSRQGVPQDFGGEGIQLYSENLPEGIPLNSPAGLAALQRAGVTAEEAESSWINQLQQSNILEKPAVSTRVVTPGARRTAEQDDQELLMRK
jgi:hypothetical protein